MPNTSSHDATTYFSGLADRYDRFRPGYPDEAIDLVIRRVGGRGAVIADVGCGTGISSRLLAAHGAKVIGIEPNDDMRAAAIAIERESKQGIEYRAATADDTHLDDESIDGVVCAQSFHWFEGSPALREFHRITRAGGILALMWNVRDEEASEASRAYEDTVRRAQEDTRSRGQVVGRNREGDPTEGGFFHSPRNHVFSNPISYTRDALHGRAQSASYFPRQGPVRDELSRALDELFDRYARDGMVTLEQKCHVTIARRAS